MLDQSFSTDNFRKIFDLENRKGNYLEGDFFPELEKLSQKVQASSHALREIRRKRSSYAPEKYQELKKAYGPNNSILDNCHVRIAFATNDERTAKRVSDALGTTTELRSQKNYTGHRLAPWLSHMMVSRQETQRALITPGEVMQLSARDEIVMVSGAPPVHAQKLRYFKDRNFTQRVLSPAPVEWSGATCDAEWISIIAAPPFKEPAAKVETEPDSVSLKRTREPEHTIDEGTKKCTTDRIAEPDHDDELDPTSDQNLETVRHAVAADRGDPDVLPGF